MREDGEDEGEAWHSVGADGPQPDEDSIARRSERKCQRAAVQLPPAAEHRRTLVDLDVRLVARDRRRHFVMLPANVDLHASLFAVTVWRFK